MRKIILSCLVWGILISGCATEKENILKRGSFEEKINYLSYNYSNKEEVVEFLGPPDEKQDFFAGVSIWKYYKSIEQPLEITFGRDGLVLGIETKR